MALPNDKITITLVANTLGASSRDVGALCTHTAINKWSKWKPVRYNSVTGLTEAQLRTAKYGLDLLVFQTAEELIDFYEANPAYSWGYLKPLTADPKRLGDFRNYDHTASRFYEHDPLPEKYYRPFTRVEAQMRSYNYNLRWSDFNMGDTHRFGAVLVRSGGGFQYKREALAPTALNDQSLSFADIPINDLPVGSYNVYSFITEYDGIIQLGYIPLEGGNMGTVELKNSALYITLNGELNTSMNKLTWELKIFNELSNNVVLQDCSIQWRYNDNGIFDPMELGEGSRDLGNITANGQSTAIRNGTELLALIDYNTRGGRMYFSCLSHPELNGWHSLHIP